MDLQLLFLICCVGGLVALLLLRVPAAVALCASGLIGLTIVSDFDAALQGSIARMTGLNNFSLTAIPLFILTGEILFNFGFASRAIAALSGLLGPVPGRLAVLSTAAGTFLGVASGSSTATTAILTRTLRQEMDDKEYSTGLSTGALVSSGGLGTIIPPSALAVVLGAIGGIPVGPLLLGGLLPGIILAIGIATTSMIWAAFFRGAPQEGREGRARIPVGRLVLDLFPVVLVAASILGSIVFGIATPTEAAAIGTIMALLLVVIYRNYSTQAMATALRDSAKTTGMIMFLVVGALLFSQALAAGGVTRDLVTAMTSLGAGAYGSLLLMLLIVIFLGLWLESVSIVLITIPLFMPIVTEFGIDPVWFGVMMLIALEIGLITPPFGLNLFVLKALTPDVSLRTIYVGATPYVGANLVVLTLVLFFPFLALAVPSLL